MFFQGLDAGKLQAINGPTMLILQHSAWFEECQYKLLHILIFFIIKNSFLNSKTQMLPVSLRSPKYRRIKYRLPYCY